MLAHQFYAIGLRTQAAPFEKTEILRQAQRNSFRTACYLFKTKSMFRGFVPAFFLYSAMCYPALKQSIGETVEYLQNKSEKAKKVSKIVQQLGSGRAQA